MLSLEESVLKITSDELVGLPVGVAMAICAHIDVRKDIKVYDTTQHNKRVFHGMTMLGTWKLSNDMLVATNISDYSILYRRVKNYKETDDMFKLYI